MTRIGTFVLLPTNYQTILSNRTGLSQKAISELVANKEVNHLALPHIERLTREHRRAQGSDVKLIT